MSKVSTISFGSVKAYAKVADRLKDFREKNPRASVKTEVIPQDGGMIIQATILTDKADISSADATGSAYYPEAQLKRDKGFEKLETIAVGRALALLGWLNDGEIASTEEMEEFTEFKQARKDEARKDFIKKLKSTKSLDELKAVYIEAGDLLDETVVKAKDEMKAKLSKEAKDEKN